jgi:hypothetical protein
VSDTRRNHEGSYYVGPPDPDVVAEWKANLQAARLRSLGLSYGSVSTVIREYHGVHRSAEGWRAQLLKQGAPRARPRGRSVARA